MTHRSAVCTASGAVHGVCLSAVCAAVAQDVAFGLACGLVAGLYFGLLAMLHTAVVADSPVRRSVKARTELDPRGPVVATIHACGAAPGPVMHVDVRRMGSRYMD